MTPQPWHGTVNGYGNRKCRCDDCRKAWREYTLAGGYQKRYRDKLQAAGLNRNSSFTRPVPRVSG